MPSVAFGCSSGRAVMPSVSKGFLCDTAGVMDAYKKFHVAISVSTHENL